MKKILRIGGYARVSHEEQKNYGYSISAQTERIQEFCKYNNYNLIDLYVDEGFSATTMNRPQLQRLLTELDRIDAIVFTKLDRFSRNVLEANKMLETFKKNKVSIIAIDEDDINTTDADGMFMFNFKVSLAERESNKGSERINAVFKYKVKKGQPISGSLPLGYKILNTNDGKRVVKNEDEIHIIEDLFDFFLTHQSINLTTKYINEKYDLKKDYRAIKKILYNPLFTGVYRENQTFTEPYITQETHEQILNILKSNVRSTNNTRDYLFSSMFKCPECNYTLIGNSYVNTAGKRYYNYRCKNAYANNRCSNKKPVSENLVEKYLLKNLNVIIEREIKVVNVESTLNIKPKKRLKEIQDELNNLNYMYLKKRINQTQYDNLYSQLEIEMKELKVESPLKPNIELLQNLLNSDWKEMYVELSRENKRAFWRSFISEIKCNKDYEIELIFCKC